MTNSDTVGPINLSLPNGCRLSIRHLVPEDALLLSEMGKLCSAEDLRFRFLHSVRDSDEKVLRRLTELDPSREFALIAFAAHNPVPLAVVRLHGTRDGQAAEFAILVRSDQQGCGLGRAMMRLMIKSARDHHMPVIKGQVLSDNTRMLRLSSSLGFSRMDQGHGVTEIRLDIDPTEAVPKFAKLPASTADKSGLRQAAR